MSKDLTTSLQMHVFTIDTAYEVIKENLQTDEDFNGNNEEYTDEEAIEAGFNSNFEYYLNMYWLEHNPHNLETLELFFKEFFDFMQERDQFYDIIEFEMKQVNDQIILAIVMVTGC